VFLPQTSVVSQSVGPSSDRLRCVENKISRVLPSCCRHHIGHTLGATLNCPDQTRRVVFGQSACHEDGTDVYWCRGSRLHRLTFVGSVLSPLRQKPMSKSAIHAIGEVGGWWSQETRPSLLVPPSASHWLGLTPTPVPSPRAHFVRSPPSLHSYAPFPSFDFRYLLLPRVQDSLNRAHGRGSPYRPCNLAFCVSRVLFRHRPA
jgi:hypothetical protein